MHVFFVYIDPADFATLKMSDYPGVADWAFYPNDPSGARLRIKLKPTKEWDAAQADVEIQIMKFLHPEA